MVFNPHKPTNSLLVLNSPEPFIYVSEIALKKMWEYVDLCPSEIGWYGSVTELDNGEDYQYRIDDVFLFEQTVSAVHTTATPEAGFDLLEKLQEKDINLNTIKLWGHSHVKMDTGPSGQDHTQMMDSFSDHFPWAIRVIANKLGKLEFSVYLYAKELVVKDVGWKSLEVSEFREDIALEIKALVTKQELPKPSTIIPYTLAPLNPKVHKGLDPFLIEYIDNEGLSYSARNNAIYDRRGVVQYDLNLDLNELQQDAETYFTERYNSTPYREDTV